MQGQSVLNLVLNLVVLVYWMKFHSGSGMQGQNNSAFRSCSTCCSFSFSFLAWNLLDSHVLEFPWSLFDSLFDLRIYCSIRLFMYDRTCSTKFSTKFSTSTHTALLNLVLILLVVVCMISLSTILVPTSIHRYSSVNLSTGSIGIWREVYWRKLGFQLDNHIILKWYHNYYCNSYYSCSRELLCRTSAAAF